MRKIGTPECKHDKRKDVHNEVLHFFLKLIRYTPTYERGENKGL